jgi:hypothetical protein
MMKLKKKSSHKKIKEERESQFGLTWLTCHSRHEIEIKKIRLSKKELSKKIEVN